tara:strand:+ start:351 stop:1217 length:867 start_codon:yes stop_codon:yes gene_type:complete
MIKILQGNCLDKLKELPDQSINTCITSPPYWGLRDYGEDKQLGMEDTPEEFVNNLVEVFREVKRVLRDDGTVWLNLGDTFLPNKQLGCIPFKVAMALQQDGFYLRQDIIWHKPNPMPESVKDRCTKAHEYIFLLSKSPKYYFDNEAIKEDAKFPDGPNTPKSIKAVDGVYSKNLQKIGANPKRNKRSVWIVTTKPSFKGAHFATFPMDLIEPCVLAGCPENGTVLDPFGGSGTTGIVASNHNRKAVLIELNAEYIEIARQRIQDQGGLFTDLEIVSGDSKVLNGDSRV